MRERSSSHAEHHDAHEHHHHHHHGLIGRGFHAVSDKILRFNEKLGNKLGGSKHAGRLGAATMLTRNLGNAGALGMGIGAFVILGTSVATGGAAVPAWFIAGGAAALALGVGSTFVGMGANHLKINQYYDALFELNAENTRLGKSKNIDVEAEPHGMKEYWQRDRKLFNMVLKRRTQEGLSVAGTLMSGAAGLAAVPLIVIAPPAAIGLFFASRAVSFGTAGGAAYNKRNRLSIYKAKILSAHLKYIEITGKINQEKAQQADRIIGEIFDQLGIDRTVTDITKSSQWRTFNVAHSVYRMLISQSENLDITNPHSFLNPANQADVVATLKEGLEPFIREKKKFRSGEVSHYFDRDALRHVDATNEYTTDTALPLLSATKVLATKLEDRLYETVAGEEIWARSIVVADRVIANFQINTAEDSLNRTLKHSIKSAVLKGIVAGRTNDELESDISNGLAPFLKLDVKKIKTGKKWDGIRATYENLANGTVLDTKKLETQFPAQGHPHGSNFMPQYHLSRLTDTITDAALGHRVNLSEPVSAQEPAISAEATLPIARPVKRHNAPIQSSPSTFTPNREEYAENPRARLLPAEDVQPDRSGILAQQNQLLANYAEFKIHLAKCISGNKNQAQQNQAVVEQIVQVAADVQLDFILVRTYENTDGHTVYLWADRNHPNNNEYGITYIEHKDTRQITVQCGARAQADVIIDADVQKGISPLVMQINKGKSAFVGDKNNQGINLAASYKSATKAAAHQTCHLDALMARRDASPARGYAAA